MLQENDESATKKWQKIQPKKVTRIRQKIDKKMTKIQQKKWQKFNKKVTRIQQKSDKNQ